MKTMNFKNKLGFINYQGCLIEGTGNGYKWGKKEYKSFGEVVVAIQDARKFLSLSIKK